MTRTGYMCLTDWQHELGENAHGIEVYRSVAALKRDRPCTDECGIAKVSVELVEIVQEAKH